MGLGGISVWQLLIVLVIVVLIFGTKRLGSLGKDLGGAVKGFRSAMDGADKDEEDPKQVEGADAQFSEAGTEEKTAESSAEKSSS